jgi:hypothetical protein
MPGVIEQLPALLLLGLLLLLLLGPKSRLALPYLFEALLKAFFFSSSSLFSLAFICSMLSGVFVVLLSVVLCPLSGPQGFR